MGASTSSCDFTEDDLLLFDQHVTEDLSTDVVNDDSNTYRHRQNRYYVAGLLVLGVSCCVLGLALRGPAVAALQGIRASQSTILTSPSKGKDCLFVSMGPGTLCKSSKDDDTIDGGG